MPYHFHCMIGSLIESTKHNEYLWSLINKLLLIRYWYHQVYTCDPQVVSRRLCCFQWSLLSPVVSLRMLETPGLMQAVTDNLNSQEHPPLSYPVHHSQCNTLPINSISHCHHPLQTTISLTNYYRTPTAI